MSYGEALSQLGNPIILTCIIVSIGGVALYYLVRWLMRSTVPRSRGIKGFGNVLAPEQPALASAQAGPAPSDLAETAKYSAMLFTNDGIKFKTIPQKLNSVIYCDPSMPKSGVKYLGVEKEDGKIEAYDPRGAPIISNETPQRAWRATHVYDLVKSVWSTPAGNWEKLNMVFMWVFCGSLVFVVIIIVSELGGK